MQSAPIGSCQSKSTTSARGCGTSPYSQAMGNSNGLPNPQLIGHVWDLKALFNMLQPSALGGDLFWNVRSLGGLPQIHP